MAQKLARDYQFRLQMPDGPIKYPRTASDETREWMALKEEAREVTTLSMNELQRNRAHRILIRTEDERKVKRSGEHLSSARRNH